jgi:hypothetical protein
VDKSVKNVTATWNTHAHTYPALGSYWLAHEARRDSSEPMGTGQRPFLLTFDPYCSLFLFPSIMQEINNIHSNLIHTMIVKCIKYY